MVTEITMEKLLAVARAAEALQNAQFYSPDPISYSRESLTLDAALRAVQTPSDE